MCVAETIVDSRLSLRESSGASAKREATLAAGTWFAIFRRLGILLLLAMLAPVTAAAAEEPAAVQESASVQEQTPVERELCRLEIDGGHVVFLKFVSKRGSTLTSENPGKVVYLPPGEYAVAEVKLEGDYSHQRQGESPGDFFELSPDRPHVLQVGTPLLPSTKVARQGTLLNLDYQLTDAAGRVYRRPGGRNAPPPRFTVYLNDQPIGSDAFEYG